MREPTRIPARARTTGALAGVQPALELLVERGEADGAAAHRHERHHVGARVEAVARRDPLAHEVEHGVAHRLLLLLRDEEEVLVELDVRAERRARVVGREERQLAGVDPARAPHDQRPRRLPVDRGQVDARHDAAESTRSASTRPAPIGGSWSVSPTRRTWQSPAARKNASASSSESIDASSTMTRS